MKTPGAIYDVGTGYGTGLDDGRATDKSAQAVFRLDVHG
jgi:hypothetical protein